MKYTINNKKSNNHIILLTIIIIVLLIIYFYGSSFLCSINKDNFSILNTLNLDNLPVKNNLVGAYTSDSLLANEWKDISGNNNHATISGVIKVIDNYIVGTTFSSIEFPTTILPEEYTLINIAKYNGKNRGRIFSGIGSNWLSGFSNGKVGVAYHDGWLTISNNVPDDWVLSSDQNMLYTANSYNFTTGYANGTTNLSVNSDSDENLSRSDWAIACVLVYNRTLSLEEIKLVEKYLINTYNNLLKFNSEEIPIIYKDNIVELPTLIYHDVYPKDETNNYQLSPNVIENLNKYFSINKISKILNIKTNDDIELLMVDGKFRLKVNLPLVSPNIKGLNFDVKNGINPNYFYLGVEKLDKNCKINSETKCENIYIDNKDCINKNLSDNINSSYRLVLIPGFYAINDDYQINNIDFTLTKIDGLIYLMNINTGYLPQIFVNDNSLNIYATMINDNNSNVVNLYQETTNIICNESQNTINMNDPTLNISCVYKPDPMLYLLTTKDINNSSPISFTIKKNKTIRINLNKYDMYGNLENTFTLSSCNYDVNTLKNIETITNTNLEKILINLVCINSDNSNSNYLDFIVELINSKNESLLDPNIQTI
jgi:hypothetical protein